MGEILTKQGTKVELGKRFNVSQPTIRAALRGQTRSALSEKIRHTAVKEFGGVETNKQ